MRDFVSYHWKVMKWKSSLSGDSKLKCSVKLLLKMGKNSYMDWGQYITMNYAQNLRKYPNKTKQTTFRIFQNSERNLVMHFHRNVYRYISSFHWASGTKKGVTKYFACGRQFFVVEVLKIIKKQFKPLKSLFVHTFLNRALYHKTIFWRLHAIVW